jgi:hypothetical protein
MSKEIVFEFTDETEINLKFNSRINKFSGGSKGDTSNMALLLLHAYMYNKEFQESFDAANETIDLLDTCMEKKELRNSEIKISAKEGNGRLVLSFD